MPKLDEERGTVTSVLPSWETTDTAGAGTAGERRIIESVIMVRVRLTITPTGRTAEMGKIETLLISCDNVMNPAPGLMSFLIELPPPPYKPGVADQIQELFEVTEWTDAASDDDDENTRFNELKGSVVGARCSVFGSPRAVFLVKSTLIVSYVDFLAATARR